MRFVAVKAEGEQAHSVVFWSGALLAHQRTQTINALRGYHVESTSSFPLGPTASRS